MALGLRVQIVQREDFRTLVNKYGAQVLNTALRILGDTQKAQDVHQEVFLSIWRRWHKFNDRTSWNAYLYRVTIRKAIRFAKQLRAESLKKQSSEHFVSNQQPDGLLREAELKKKLAKYLTKLPKRQAEIFVLSRIEGLRHETIAEMLDCSENTVRVHLHRAVKRLAQQLSDYLD
jgi:RNA polymerase sigma-70 factor (ECF subfamily)